LPRAGAAATAGAAVLAPALASYTAALITDTAVPAWHDGHREMPFVSAGSAAMAAGGFGLVAAPPGESEPARNLALFGIATEAAPFERRMRRVGLAAAHQRWGGGCAGWAWPPRPTGRAGPAPTSGPARRCPCSGRPARCSAGPVAGA